MMMRITTTHKTLITIIILLPSRPPITTPLLHLINLLPHITSVLEILCQQVLLLFIDPHIPISDKSHYLFVTRLENGLLTLTFVGHLAKFAGKRCRFGFGLFVVYS
jgi:hypothetical protein